MSTEQHSKHLFHPKYRPDIDGLRGVAVLSVVAFHFFPKRIPSGFVGVDIFFVISGFLISTIIFQSLDKGSFSFREFYIRRIRRIFPALIIVLLSCLIFGWLALLPDELNQLGKHIVAGTGFISNLVLWSEAGYFDVVAESKPLLHLWSLGIEEQFYIIWPLLLWFAYKKRRNLFVVSIIVATVSFLLNIKEIHSNPVAAFYSPQTRFWELLCGSLLAYCVLYWRKISAHFSYFVDRYLTVSVCHKFILENFYFIQNFFSILGFIITTYGFIVINKEIGFPGKYALIPVVGAICIILAGSQAWVNRYILSNKIAVWFGLISFPLYLWHWPLITFARIIDNGDVLTRHRNFALIISIILAWLTVKLVESPFRFGKKYINQKLAILITLMVIISLLGFYTYKSDRSQTNQYQNLVIKRRDFENMVGSSLLWYEGKNKWLFLGNQYDKTVAKLKLNIIPSKEQIEQTIKPFSDIAATAAQYDTKVVVIIGPNKSTIYPEYLPHELTPSSKRYMSFFLDELRNIPNLIVYDPTEYLLNKKKTEGILYWRTDTHWNQKGSYLAYEGLAKQINLPIPQISFHLNGTHSGDLIGISKLSHFPVMEGDNWDYLWENTPTWIETDIKIEKQTAFGPVEIVSNPSAPSKDKVWVIGDSFSQSLRPLFNASFVQTVYMGHWADKLSTVSDNLKQAKEKPNMIIIERVERSF